MHVIGVAYRTAVCACLGLWATSAPAETPCVWDWAKGFEPRGVAGGSGAGASTVHALAAFDDGSGPALYVGGNFDVAGEAVAENIARWDGVRWSTVGEGLTGSGSLGTVHAFVEFDDGAGRALYVANDTYGGVRKWDGQQWTDLGASYGITSLVVFDDGFGPALYGARASWSQSRAWVLLWDGFSWTEVGSFQHYDFDPQVYALAAYDDGTGPALYAGGHFTKVNGLDAAYIARWDGTAWSAVGGGMSGVPYTDSGVSALQLYDDGSGLALYAGGQFLYAGGVWVSGIARWDGTAWSPLGSGLDDEYWPDLNALAVYDAGAGPVLCVGGMFEHAGGVEANNVATWDGASWAPVGAGTKGDVLSLAVLDTGAGPALFAGGKFTLAGGEPAAGVAKWDGANWSPLGGGQGMNGQVNALAYFDDGSGPLLYAGGGFTTAGAARASGIAYWSGQEWRALASELEAYANSFELFDDGTGPALYVSGYFVGAGGVGVPGVLKWDGVQWHSLGWTTNESVGRLAIFDDGAGTALYATLVPPSYSSPAYALARWDGQSWSHVGGNLTYPNQIPYTAGSAVFDDGAGPALYVGGRFTTIGGVAANNVAKWDGTAWSPLGLGIRGNANVFALTVFDDGSGPALYVGGSFTWAGDLRVNSIAKWDGQAWSDVGGGVLDGAAAGFIIGLSTVIEHDRPMLLAGGFMTSAGGVPARNVASWDGSGWSALGAGADDWVGAFAARDGAAPGLHIGGAFTEAGGHSSAYIAEWRCVGHVADVNCDSAVDWHDIEPFVSALVDPERYEVAYPDCHVRTADCNQDGRVDLFDIDPFVRYLTGP